MEHSLLSSTLSVVSGSFPHVGYQGATLVSVTPMKLTSLLTKCPQSFHLASQQTLHTCGNRRRYPENFVHHCLRPAPLPRTGGILLLLVGLGFAEVIPSNSLYMEERIVQVTSLTSQLIILQCLGTGCKCFFHVDRFVVSIASVFQEEESLLPRSHP